MTVEISLHMWHAKTTLEALLDCGATHNFIDKATVNKLHLGMRPLKQILTVNKVDDTTNLGGDITHYCNLWITRGDTTHKHGFYVANLGRDRLILGHPWFKTFNPNIDWRMNQLEGDKIVIETAGHHSKQRETTHQLVINEGEVKTEAEGIMEQILPEYYHHWQVFSEKASHHYPPAWDKDHVITLKPGAPATMDCKIY